MAQLHDALKYLAPVEWQDVPHGDPEQLQQYMTDNFTAGELVCNSIPQQPNGTPFDTSQPFHRHPNSAKSHQEMHPSAVRSQPPHPDHEALQKLWGKPMKFNKKDNPLDIHVYKTAGHDRHGAWFARRSIHEGLGFDKFKKAMMREFAESMAVTGGPGAGAIRGLAADRRLENIHAKGVGDLEVFQLSAQFPGPVTPRDFTIMVSTSEDALSDKSASQLDGGKRHVPRHYMIVSKPVDHPDAPQRAGYVRGQYESVEMIREIPLCTAKSKSTPNLLSQAEHEHKARERSHTVGITSESADQLSRPHGDGEDGPVNDPELNPVEWIMITRSDPGGGIPRFLVERGTPETMLQDVHKFFNWACRQDSNADPDNQPDVSAQANNRVQADGVAPSDLATSGGTDSTRSVGQPATTQPVSQTGDGTQGGLLANLTKAIEVGLDTYAPASVAAMVHSRLDPAPDVETSDDSSSTGSFESFMSAEELGKASTAPETLPQGSTDNLSVATGDSSDVTKDRKDLTRHDKEVMKLAQKRERLEQRLAKKRMEEQEKLRQAQEKDTSEAAKQKDRIEKELQKTEEKHRRDVEKLERQRQKEAEKAEAKRKKKDDQNKMSLVTRERDDFRSQADLFRRENDLLREQVADLQAQNTAMADRIAKLGGEGALKSVQEDMGRKRAGSNKSRASRVSTDSTLKE